MENVRFQFHHTLVHFSLSGCLCLCVCVYSVAELCPTLCKPKDCSPLGSSVHGILPARILEWVAILQRIFLTQGSNLGLLHCRQILYHLSYRKYPNYCMYWYKIGYLCEFFKLPLTLIEFFLHVLLFW